MGGFSSLGSSLLRLKSCSRAQENACFRPEAGADRTRHHPREGIQTPGPRPTPRRVETRAVEGQLHGRVACHVGRDP